MEDKKHSVIEEWKHFDHEETMLRVQKKARASRSMVKIELTDQDRRNLMELIKAKRDFEVSLERKNQ